MDDVSDDQTGGGFRPTFVVRRNPYYKSSKILLIAIISLVAVVLSVLLLHIYAKYVLRRQARRRAALRRLSLRVAAQLSMSEPPPKTGLDPVLIATLPTFIFKTEPDEEEEEEAARPECSVCLGALSDGDVARRLPNCNHVFHVECIDKWLSLHGTCPVCRTEAEPRLRTEPREGPVLRGAGSSDVEPVCDNAVGTSEGGEGHECGNKRFEAGSRFGSFRRMIARDRSGSLQRVRSFEQGDYDDLEDPQIQR